MLKKFFLSTLSYWFSFGVGGAGRLPSFERGYQAPEKEIAPASEEEIEEIAEIKEITVSGTEYSFNPPSITVSAGERMRVTFKNTGSIGHNFVVRDLGISTKTIRSGQTDTIEFTVPQSGTYTFICSVPGHKLAGMKGTLEVK